LRAFHASTPCRRRSALLCAILLVAACRQTPPDSTQTSVGATGIPLAPTPETVPLQEEPPPLIGTIVFHADREGRQKIFALDLASHTVTGLTTGAAHHDEDPAWSPDGTKLAFASTRFDHRTYDIAVMDVATSDVRRVTDDAAFENHPMWWPDGRGLVFSSEREGTQAVFRLAFDTGALTRLSPRPERALMPAPAPDGRRIAFTMGTANGLQIGLLEVDSENLRQLTSGPSGAARPRWSPDGTRLAYARLGPGASFIEILEVATGQAWSLAVTGMASLVEPVWSPDGQWLAAAGEAEGWDLILVQAGPPAAAYRLTRGPGNDRAPSWQPR
jgi:Tol biopolymer transport system component